MGTSLGKHAGWPWARRQTALTRMEGSGSEKVKFQRTILDLAIYRFVMLLRCTLRILNLDAAQTEVPPWLMTRLLSWWWGLETSTELLHFALKLSTFTFRIAAAGLGDVEGNNVLEQQ